MNKMKIISEQNIEKAKNEIKKAARPVIIQAQDENFNRKLLEYGNFDILLSPEKNTEKDRLKQMNSGLNHVLAKIAAKNKVAIGIDLEDIRHMEKKDKAIRLAKLRQNIQICRKAKAKIKLLDFNSKQDAKSFLLSLGASTSQAAEAITF